MEKRPGRNKWERWQHVERWEVLVPVKKLVEWFNWLFKRR